MNLYTKFYSTSDKYEKGDIVSTIIDDSTGATYTGTVVGLRGKVLECDVPRLGRHFVTVKYVNDVEAASPVESDRDKLTRINHIIYGNGAPLGSDEYFEIRKICVGDK
jgi:hypothetical protein